MWFSSRKTRRNSRLHSFGTIFRLAAVVVLSTVTAAGTRFTVNSAAGEHPSSSRILLGSPALSQPGTPFSQRPGAAATPRLQNFSRIPLSFEPNQGQTDPVQYLARGPGYTVFLTATE